MAGVAIATEVAVQADVLQCTLPGYESTLDYIQLMVA